MAYTHSLDFAQIHAGLYKFGVTVSFKKDTVSSHHMRRVCMQFNSTEHFHRLATSRSQFAAKTFFEDRLDKLGLGMTMYEYDRTVDNMYLWITVPVSHMKQTVETALDQLIFINAMSN